jgi:hypothetical protein
MFAKITNQAIEKYPYSIGDLRKANPNVSFSAYPSDDDLRDYGLERVYFSTQPSFAETQVLEESTPVFNTESQRWEQVWVVREMTQEEMQNLVEEKSNIIRQDRNQKLASSDWTQVADAPVDKATWATYRQALRDITSQSGFPLNVTYPDVP